MKAIEMQTYGDEVNMALLRRCQGRDPEAYNEFFSLYQRKVFNTAYRILGEEASAEDALQETMLNVYRGLANFRGDSKISTWISRITINVCLGMLRKSRNYQSIDLDEDFSHELPAEATPYTDPLEHAEHNELQMYVRESLHRMSKKQSLVVRLHDVEGHTIQEISRIINCPVGTVKSRLFYGRQEFKDIFTALMKNGHRAPSLN